MKFAPQSAARTNNKPLKKGWNTTCRMCYYYFQCRQDVELLCIISETPRRHCFICEYSRTGTWAKYFMRYAYLQRREPTPFVTEVARVWWTVKAIYPGPGKIRTAAKITSWTPHADTISWTHWTDNPKKCDLKTDVVNLHKTVRLPLKLITC